MSERKKISTNIHLNLAKDADRRAWTYLQNMDRKKYKSYSKVVVMALNDFFERQERLAADPYLETREKEEYFFRRLQEIVERCMRESGINALGGLAALLQGTQPPVPAPVPTETTNNGTNEDFEAAMDFINNL